MHNSSICFKNFCANAILVKVCSKLEWRQTKLIFLKCTTQFWKSSFPQNDRLSIIQFGNWSICQICRSLKNDLTHILWSLACNVYNSAVLQIAGLPLTRTECQICTMTEECCKTSIQCPLYSRCTSVNCPIPSAPTIYTKNSSKRLKRRKTKDLYSCVMSCSNCHRQIIGKKEPNLLIFTFACAKLPFSRAFFKIKIEAQFF